MNMQRLKNEISKLHDDEDGLEAVQTIMIVAIAAIILIAVMTLGQKVFDWLKKKWGELEGKNIS